MIPLKVMNNEKDLCNIENNNGVAQRFTTNMNLQDAQE